MKKIPFFIGIPTFFILLVSAFPAAAHVPFLEHYDYSEERPFFVRDIEKSIAAYSWLKTENGSSHDIDLYLFYISSPTRIFIEALVPICSGYEDLLPAFAVVGPGLPVYEGTVPFEIPDGYGAVVVENYLPGDPRPTFFEPFGGKSYYDGPDFDQVLETPGLYYVYFWDPAWVGGDYVAVLGYRETWKLPDIIRGIINTPKIRRDEELHQPCE